MFVGIVGLGLIGGSLAKAYKEAGHTVYGFDTDQSIANYAQLSGVIDAALDEQTISCCNIIHIATYPDAAVDYMTAHASQFPDGCIVMDDCGTKRKVCQAGFELAAKHHYTYVGAHPMAGTKFSGFKYSRATMFAGAPMIIVPPTFDDINLYDRLKQLLEPLQLKNLVFTTADDHDQMIAFTSQLAHVVSNAYVKSPAAQRQKGYSAGSFRDMTRVAWLNEQMWTELFLENKDNLINEITTIIDNLTQYRDAMQADDADKLCDLLREGRIAKEQCG